jgi:hypothetical protein
MALGTQCLLGSVGAAVYASAGEPQRLVLTRRTIRLSAGRSISGRPWPTGSVSVEEPTACHLLKPIKTSVECGLTNHWSGRVRDEVPSSDADVRAAQVNR